MAASQKKEIELDLFQVVNILWQKALIIILFYQSQVQGNNFNVC